MIHRRNFLKAGIGGAAAVSLLEAKAFARGNEKPLRVALIGSGWYGKTDLLHLMQVAPIEVVGLCDVDSQMVAAAAELVSRRQPSKKRPPTYGDYEKLLSAETPEIVLIGTPDHWHCLPMIAACKAGADVYCQKPISYDVVEGQAMVAAARKYGRTVQVGLQRRSTPHLLEARDKFIRSGALGKVAHVEIHSISNSPSDFPPDTAPPAHLDWDMFVGPAPMRRYNPGIHPRGWRAAREFSNGQTGDLCVHFFDVVRYFLDLGWPRQITANGGSLVRRRESSSNVPDTQTALFDFGDLQFVWNQRNWGLLIDPMDWWSATLFGEKGTLRISIYEYDFIPKAGSGAAHADSVDESAKYPEDKEHKETELFAAPATRRHMQNFLEARRDKKRPVADIEQGHISSACCILANLSMELGRSLKLDTDTGRIVDDDEATQRLARPYRSPWVHPTPENV
jgi:predicted dehydrogenase